MEEMINLKRKKRPSVKNNLLFISIATTSIITLAVGIVLAQMPPGGKGRPPGHQSPSSASPGVSLSYITRHQFVLENGVDSDYANKTNPLTTSEQNLLVGRSIFEKRCAICHVESLKNHLKTKYMRPEPPDLSISFRLPVAMDTYLFWTISRGGIRFNTSMPGFKNSTGRHRLENQLSDKQIWQIVLYIINEIKAESKTLIDLKPLPTPDQPFPKGQMEPPPHLPPGKRTDGPGPPVVE